MTTPRASKLQFFPLENPPYGFETDLDIERNEARALLPTLKVRTTDDPGNGVKVEVLYEGRWRYLCREDAAHQVRSSISWTSNPEFFRDPLAYFTKRIVFGVRVDADHFTVIDDTTDH